MKKTILATLIMLSATMSQAMELGVTGSRDNSLGGRDSVGVTLGQKFGNFGVTGGLEQANRGDNQTRATLTGSYDFYKVGPVSLNAQLGVAYLRNQNSENGYAATAGLGAELPVTTNVSVTGVVSRQFGQERVSQFNGNHVTLGVKYKF